MFLPENIDFAFSEKYILSIRLLPDGFSFSVHQPDDPSVFYYKKAAFGNKMSYVENIKKLIFDFSFFTQTFRETRVIAVSQKYTLVPEYFFDKSRAESMFNFNVQDGNGLVLHQQVPEIEGNVVFDMDTEVHSFLSRNLWNPVFSHHIQSLLSYFATHHADFGGKRCYVDFRDKFIDVCCLQSNTLLSANTFAVTDRLDALYFITGVWEKLPLQQISDRLYLTGNVNAQKEAVDTLKKLIRYVEILSFSPKTEIPDAEKPTLPTGLLLQLCE